MMAILTTNGARKVSRIVPIVPAMKEPMAAVASAAAPRPWRAIRLPSMAVTMWLAIDDADRGNAAMKYIPVTHVLGHLTYKLSETDPSNVLNQTVPGAEKFGAPVYVELKAGEASIHSDLLLHGSEANESPRRRCPVARHRRFGQIAPPSGIGRRRFALDDHSRSGIRCPGLDGISTQRPASS